MWFRRLIILMALLSAGFSVTGRASSSASGVAGERPNIILIMADDVGRECFGCYGSAQYETPHIDSLAAEGLRFAHAYSQPLCTPSRVKLMTGRSNIRNYVAFGVLDPRERTFAHMLRGAGYATAVAGKWQLHGSRFERKPVRVHAVSTSIVTSVHRQLSQWLGGRSPGDHLRAAPFARPRPPK